MTQIVIHIEDHYTPEYWEKLEDLLKELLESEGLHGHIEDGFTGNSTRFDGESHRAVITVSFGGYNGKGNTG